MVKEHFRKKKGSGSSKKKNATDAVETPSLKKNVVTVNKMLAKKNYRSKTAFEHARTVDSKGKKNNGRC